MKIPAPLEILISKILKLEKKTTTKKPLNLNLIKVKEMMLLLTRKTLSCALEIPQNKILENVSLVTVGGKKKVRP